MTTLFYIPTSNMWEVQWLSILTNTCYYLSFFTVILVYVKLHFIMVLIIISLITSDVEYFYVSIIILKSVFVHTHF